MVQGYVCCTLTSLRTVHGVTCPKWHRRCISCTFLSHSHVCTLVSNRTVHGVTCPIWHRSCVSCTFSSHYTVHEVNRPISWHRSYVCSTHASP